MVVETGFQENVGSCQVLAGVLAGVSQENGGSCQVLAGVLARLFAGKQGVLTGFPRSSCRRLPGKRGVLAGFRRGSCQASHRLFSGTGVCVRGSGAHQKNKRFFRRRQARTAEETVFAKEH